MENDYRLMKESMLELDIREFENTRLFNDYICFSGKEIIRAFQKPVTVYPEKEIKVEIKLLHWFGSDIEIKAQIPYRVVFLDKEPYFEKGQPFKIHLKELKDKTLRFNSNGILSKKLFMPPFEAVFRPREILNMTYLSKRKDSKSQYCYPYKDELGFAHLYWSKREREQKKYYKAIKELGVVIPDYRDAIIRRELSKLDFTLKSSVC